MDIRSDDECWPWMLSLSAGTGYGSAGKHGPSAHRRAYMLTYGSIPVGMYVLHRCDNPPCCNPAHLVLGSQADNMRDCAQKGRVRGGSPERFGAADRASILSLIESGQSYRELARRWGTSHGVISRIHRVYGKGAAA